MNHYELPSTELVVCPYCGAREFSAWAEELGFTAVRCKSCALIYVNPRPTLASIYSAVRTGAHGDEAQGLDVRARRIGRKVKYYRRVFGILLTMFGAAVGRSLGWTFGAGYGEVLEAERRSRQPAAVSKAWSQ